MPRTKLGDKYSRPKEPEIDWLKAAMLERMDAKRLTMKELSEASGICYATMRVLMRKSPRDWNTQQRDRVCAVLGIQTVRQVVGAPQTGGGAL